MSKKDEALKLALEALEFYYDQHGEESDAKAITAIREALAEQPAQQQEPVVRWDSDGWGDLLVDSLPDGTLLYTSPPASKPWVGLTEEEINEVLGGDIRDEPSGELEFVRAIEAKLKEKNT